MSLKVKDFDTYFQEWFETRKKRYGVIRTRHTLFIYDYLEFNFIPVPNDINENETTTIHYEEYARHKAGEMNKEWEKVLLKKIEERKKNPNTWDPLFN